MTEPIKEPIVEPIKEPPVEDKTSNMLTLEQAEKLAAQREEKAFTRGIQEQKNIFKIETEKIKAQKLEAEKQVILDDIEKDSAKKSFIVDIVGEDFKGKGVDFLSAMTKAYGKQSDTFHSNNTAKPESFNSNNTAGDSASHDEFFEKQRKARNDKK